MPYLCTQTHSHALLRPRYSAVTSEIIISPRGGVGVALGAQVGHAVTHRGWLEGDPVYMPSPKSVKNGPKRGYPLF